MTTGNYLYTGRASATDPVGTETVPVLQGAVIKLATVTQLNVSLSTSTSTGLSTATSGITSLSTSTSTGIAGRAGLTANTFTRLQTITQGTANEGILASTGFSATGTNTTGAVSIAGTLNGTGIVDFFNIAPTVTASNAASTSFAVAGFTSAARIFSIRADGAFVNLHSVNGSVPNLGFGLNGAGFTLYNYSTYAVCAIANDNAKGFAFGTEGFKLLSDDYIGFCSSNTNPISNTVDLVVSRISPGLAGIGLTAVGQYSGSLKLTNLIATGNIAGATVAAKTSNYTVTASDFTVPGDATSGAITFTLPAATGSGSVYNCAKVDGSANTVTLDGNASETINGSLTQVLSAQYSTLQIQDYASGKWLIL